MGMTIPSDHMSIFQIYHDSSRHGGFGFFIIAVPRSLVEFRQPPRPKRRIELASNPTGRRPPVLCRLVWQHMSNMFLRLGLAADAPTRTSSAGYSAGYLLRFGIRLTTRHETNYAGAPASLSSPALLRFASFSRCHEIACFKLWFASMVGCTISPVLGLGTKVEGVILSPAPSFCFT